MVLETGNLPIASLEISQRSKPEFDNVDFQSRTYEKAFLETYPDYGERFSLLMTYLNSIGNINPSHKDFSNYICHPVRIAFYLSKICHEMSPDQIDLILLHNVKEVFYADNASLNEISFSDENIRLIDILTIDRDYQYDDKYLTQYYSAIAREGQFLKLLKVVDKLDNVFVFRQIPESANRKKYLDTVEKFVCPLARSVSESLYVYLSNAVNLVR